MSEKHIDLEVGDTLIVRVLAETPKKEFQVLLRIPPVTIYEQTDRSYVYFKSDLDVCTDGTGDHHGDKTPLDETAYQNGGKYLNADKDKYMVIPPQIRSMVPGVVMGCQGRVTNLETGIQHEAVVGEIGPKNKTGECAICLAQLLNPLVTANSGDAKRIYFYELWPDKPAVVDGQSYKLEPA
jgi:hypothetical protein